jgi:hypothetical protein
MNIVFLSGFNIGTLKAGFKRERQSQSPRALLKIEVGPTDFIETFCSLQSWEVALCVLLL